MKGQHGKLIGLRASGDLFLDELSIQRLFQFRIPHVMLPIYFSLAILDMHLNSHLFPALPHVPVQPAHCCCCVCLKAGAAGTFWLLMIALLPLSGPIRVDVQNVRRMFYGLLRNHSPAQVTQCSAMQEREGKEKIRGLYP